MASGSTLAATSRPSFVSVARQTSPIPPAPILAVMRWTGSLRYARLGRSSSAVAALRPPASTLLIW